MPGPVEHVKRERVVCVKSSASLLWSPDLHFIIVNLYPQDTLLECESPFLVKLHGTAQDDVNIYMMMEVVMGGELFGYLQVSELLHHPSCNLVVKVNLKHSHSSDASSPVPATIYPHA